jgi:hypothetical protein
VAEHISRKELKQDKVRETMQHGAEAVLSHTRIAAIVALLSIIGATSYIAWYFYSDRQRAESSAALEEAMKVYSARIRAAGDPLEPGEISYTDPAQRAQEASIKFMAVAAKYPGTNAGKLARYYSALCMEDLEKHNQALEELKKISSGSDKELAALAQYQIAVINARTGQQEEAIKQFRALADKSALFVPRPLVLLELAGVLKQTHPQEAVAVYEQIKKEFPNTPASEEADRGLGMLTGKA